MSMGTIFNISRLMGIVTTLMLTCVSIVVRYIYPMFLKGIAERDALSPITLFIRDNKWVLWCPMFLGLVVLAVMLSSAHDKKTKYVAVVSTVLWLFAIWSIVVIVGMSWPSWKLPSVYIGD